MNPRVDLDVGTTIDRYTVEATLGTGGIAEVHKVVHNELGSAQEAEDVVAESFLRAVRGLQSFDGRSSFRTWLYTITRNQLRDRWRRAGRRPRTVSLEHAAGEAPHEVVLEGLRPAGQVGQVDVGERDEPAAHLLLGQPDEVAADATSHAARAGVEHDPHAVVLVEADLDEVVARAERP